jgi:hypothetical protein
MRAALLALVLAAAGCADHQCRAAVADCAARAAATQQEIARLRQEVTALQAQADQLGPLQARAAQLERELALEWFAASNRAALKAMRGGGGTVLRDVLRRMPPGPVEGGVGPLRQIGSGDGAEGPGVGGISGRSR